jgi:hypothetical protein
MEGSLIVTDAAGKHILTKAIALLQGTNELVLTTSDIPNAGVYYYSIYLGERQYSKQMIKVE